MHEAYGAIRNRQEVYDSGTSLHFVFKSVKQSIKAQDRQSSPEWGQVSGVAWSHGESQRFGKIIPRGFRSAPPRLRISVAAV